MRKWFKLDFILFFSADSLTDKMEIACDDFLLVYLHYSLAQQFAYC